VQSLLGLSQNQFYKKYPDLRPGVVKTIFKDNNKVYIDPTNVYYFSQSSEEYILYKDTIDEDSLFSAINQFKELVNELNEKLKIIENREPDLKEWTAELYLKDQIHRISVHKEYYSDFWQIRWESYYIVPQDTPVPQINKECVIKENIFTFITPKMDKLIFNIEFIEIYSDYISAVCSVSVDPRLLRMKNIKSAVKELFDTIIEIFS